MLPNITFLFAQFTLFILNSNFTHNIFYLKKNAQFERIDCNWKLWEYETATWLPLLNMTVWDGDRLPLLNLRVWYGDLTAIAEHDSMRWWPDYRCWTWEYEMVTSLLMQLNMKVWDGDLTVDAAEHDGKRWWPDCHCWISVYERNMGLWEDDMTAIAHLLTPLPTPAPLTLTLALLTMPGYICLWQFWTQELKQILFSINVKVLYKGR